MKHKHEITRLAEAKESLLMALNAVAANKLRSALTLLGVLIGVFSIIVVMTAIRTEKEFSPDHLPAHRHRAHYPRRCPSAGDRQQ